MSTTPTIVRELRNLGDQRPHYLGFYLPQKEQSYCMPTAMMTSLHPSTSIYSENVMSISTSFNLYFASVFIMGNFGRMVQPPCGIGYFPPHDASSLTNNSLQVIKQLMDESNHDIIYTITQYMCNVFTPLLKNTTRSYQQLTYQVCMIVDFLRAPLVPPTPVPNVPQRVKPPENRIIEND